MFTRLTPDGDLHIADRFISELGSIEYEIKRRRWLRDPVLWCKERAGVGLWSAQRRIIEAVRDHRKVAVQSCHGIGKSFIAGNAVCWWGDVHPYYDTKIVTTAPSDQQVKAILWKEIRQTHDRAKLIGRTNLKEWLGPKDYLVAQGRKPNDYDATAFQGIHARHVLVVFDEACGIPGQADLSSVQSLWDAGASLLANEECRFLAIGNPDDPSTEFARICAPGSGFHVIKVGAFETPNFTHEPVAPELLSSLIGYSYVEEMRHDYAPDWSWNADKTQVLPPPGLTLQKALEQCNPMWASKVWGVFPHNSDAIGLIPIPWIEAACARNLPPGEPNELGVDVGAGGDSSTIAHRRGGRVRIIHEDHNPDTMQTTGTVIAKRRETKATSVKVDKIGIGAGVTDRGKEQGEPFIGINVGETAYDTERFVNKKAEFWWGVRERFEQGDVDLDPNDRRLLAELVELRYFRTSRGQIQIESKDQAKARGIPSPNRAEAVMLAFAQEIKKKRSGGLLF